MEKSNLTREKAKVLQKSTTNLASPKKDKDWITLIQGQLHSTLGRSWKQSLKASLKFIVCMWQDSLLHRGPSVKHLISQLTLPGTENRAETEDG